MGRDKDIAVVNGKEYSNDLLEYSEGRGNPNITVISESGLYRILAKCNLPKCEPWFVAKDACYCLEIADVSQACKNLDDDEKQVVARSPELSLLFTESSNAPTMTLISEAVFIAFSPNAIFPNANRGSSKKQEAKAFKRWVNHAHSSKRQTSPKTLGNDALFPQVEKKKRKK